MLSSLQQAIAAVVRDLPEAADFALAGGAALALQGVPERVTNDLDYFATAPAAVGRLLPVLEDALRQAGMAVERRQVAHGFARLEVARGTEVSEIDLGYDFRLRPPVMTPLGAVLTAEELAADKTLAVAGRGLARDYVDVHELMHRFGEENLIAWASAKEPGFSRVRLADVLDQFDRLPRQDFAVDDDTYVRIRHDLRLWRGRLLEHERTREGLERERLQRREGPGLEL